MRTFRALVAVLMLALCTSSGVVAQDAEFDQTVKPFLESYCVKCHGKSRHEGDRRFDALLGNITDDSSLSDYQDMLDQLNLAEMPPEESKQPGTEERRAVIEWLTARIAGYHATRKDGGGRTVLRRLNAREYRNTVRDLLHLDMTMFDPTTAFPSDQTTDHFDNNGETLVTSGYLLARYLDAAEQSINRALYPLEKPQVQTWTFGDNFKQQPEIDQVHRKTNKYSRITLYDVPGADKPEGAYGPIHAFRDGVPEDGFYEIRLRAEARNREHPYDPDFVGTDPAEPLRLAIVAGNRSVGDLHRPQPIEPVLAEFRLADESKWYTARVRLDAGYTPRFTFPNGLMDVRNMWGRLVKQYRDHFPGIKTARPGIVEARFNAIKFGKLPQIHIHEIEINGPLFDEWPTASQRAVLGADCGSILESGEMSDVQIRTQLAAFVTRAYRREVRADEIERVMEVIKARKQSGRSSLEAYADGLKMVLTSPGFLYHNASGEKQLTPTDLASRLSYFLSSTQPDEELTAVATSGALKQPTVRLAQAERLLADSRSDAFVEGFLDSWLTLRDLGSQPPDRGSFRDYYRFDLGSAMKRETLLFTRHLIDKNLPLTNFLDSKFTFVNRPLARLYGMEPPKKPGFHKVTLSDNRRGGLLGQASVLTVTANGIDTSPIVRGVWVLENILGTPPSPPPPDVEPLDPDIRGAKTIREQLRKHRDSPTCFSCHRKIDPLGFALETFDPIGRWRTNYRLGRRVGAKIDASGELAGGSTFADVRGLKKLLVERQNQFTRSLAEKLLAYATGRRVSVLDRPIVEDILTELEQSGGGLRDLIRLVVASDIFAR